MKEKRYTLQEEQPTPIGWHPANEKIQSEKGKLILALI